MTLPRIDLVAAMTVVTEIWDFSNFARPRELMRFPGAMPSECSSSFKRTQGKITKSVDNHARRVLDEAASNCHSPARISANLQRRWVGQHKPVRQIAWKARLRLVKCYWHVSARIRAMSKFCVAIARGLSASCGTSSARSSHRTTE